MYSLADLRNKYNYLFFYNYFFLLFFFLMATTQGFPTSSFPSPFFRGYMKTKINVLSEKCNL